MAKTGVVQEGSSNMPGKPFRSSLEPHFEEIAQRRARRETWQGIAAELEKAYGLKVHFSAVQKFFGRYQARKAQPLGFEPLSAPAATTTTEATTPSVAGSHKSVLTPKPKASSHSSDEDAQFNDPLALECEGQPVDPDAENPFKMRKRKAS